MRYLSMSLCGLIVCMNAMAGVRLPTVDVANGSISARAAFGEEVAPVKKQTVAKKVVARNATKKTTVNKIAANTGDVLKPHRPSSDLWARSAETPLRMPRVDEIMVMRSDDLLPEESLDAKPVRVAERKPVQNENLVAKNEVMQELDFLRSEIARLNELQKENKIVSARPVSVRTPISGESDVRAAVKNSDDSVNVQRRVVPMENTTARATVAEPTLAAVNDMNKMSPNELKKAFKKTYLSENKHLSTYRVDERFDVASDMTSSSVEGFTTQRDLSEINTGVRPLEIKISFRDSDSGLSRDNYNLLSETASIVVNNPKRAIQVAIPESATTSNNSRKLAARRLAIVEQVLRDTGVSEQRIVPVLSQRDDDVFVLRIISGDQFENLTQQKRNAFGDTVSGKTYKSMSW